VAVSFLLNGDEVSVPRRGTLLQALRGDLGRRDVKDGCAPQGQCGCCTVLVDGHARVSCVTPIARVEGRDVRTLDGLDPVVVDRLVSAFDATAASQCGFCTPGIVVRLAGLLARGPCTDRSVRSSLSAHLCRCTGFQPIVEAALLADGDEEIQPRDPEHASARASLESGATQWCSPDVVRGRAPFADDSVPLGAVVALGTARTGYAEAATELEARERAATRQGRNSTVALVRPVAIPDGSFDLVLQTAFVEPAYLEPDASWCEPDGIPASPLGNQGSFGAKRNSPVGFDAEALAGARGHPVVVRWTREAVVLRGEKRPPLSLGLRHDGTGAVRLGWTPGSRSLEPVADAIRRAAPGLHVEIVEIVGPPVGVTHRGAGVAEVLGAMSVLSAEGSTCRVETPNGASASVHVDDGSIHVHVDAGEPLCAATTRSYVIGAVHQAYSMVTSEGIAIDDDGVPVDLTIRSFGITPARDFPAVDVVLEASTRPARAVGSAAFAATLGAVWLAEGVAARWPTRR
jgi:xanthine dehydrogenase small subunit